MATLDLVVVAAVVAAALAWLVSRFVHPKKGDSSSGTVVVGASLQRGLDKARQRKGRGR
jgi:hypothetical protein